MSWPFLDSAWITYSSLVYLPSLLIPSVPSALTGCEFSLEDLVRKYQGFICETSCSISHLLTMTSGMYVKRKLQFLNLLLLGRSMGRPLFAKVNFALHMLSSASLEQFNIFSVFPLWILYIQSDIYVLFFEPHKEISKQGNTMLIIY